MILQIHKDLPNWNYKARKMVQNVQIVNRQKKQRKKILKSPIKNQHNKFIKNVLKISIIIPVIRILIVLKKIV